MKELAKGDSEMDMIFYLARSSKDDFHIIFMRPREEKLSPAKDDEVFVTFYSPREGTPEKLAPNHFRFPLVRTSLYHRIMAVLRVVDYELGDRAITVHFGWPMSSWLDRLAIGVMVFNLIRLPRYFPKRRFMVVYPGLARWSPK